MVKTSRSIVIAMALGALFTGLVGCRKEGPAEHAGKEIDRATEKAGDKIKDTINDMKK